VQCDLKQPICGQCEERGIQCGGYDNDRIFVHHDSRPKNAYATASPIPPTAIGNTSSRRLHDARPNDVETNNQLASLRSINGLQALDAPFIFNHMPQSTSFAQSAYREKSVEAFMGMFAPATDMRSMSHAGREVVEILPRLSASDEALRLAILALGTVALGSQTNDTELARQGRSTYGKALVETRRALQDPNRARSTAILAIPPVRAIFPIDGT
jgi:hypothetical protein